MIDDLIVYRAALQYALVFGTSAWAFARGDGPEKSVGLVLSGMIIAFQLATWLLPASLTYGEVIPVYLAIDLSVFIAFTPIAMRANRIYPLWLLAAQLIALLMHFQRDLFPSIEPLAYYALTHGPSWVQTFAFLGGMIAHRRRLRRFGSYRSWKTSSVRS
ncbi:hypothetical protein [Erythrobacter litoralis]|uniref:hypothetical protein n=1 Tax=Erythrobacter litoralis TaxID=39960 RepID=UPI002435AE8E|nr:hypothetical protein [Erythrobacter litoralis]